jgi:hypothetical protein
VHLLLVAAPLASAADPADPFDQLGVHILLLILSAGAVLFTVSRRGSLRTLALFLRGVRTEAVVERVVLVKSDDRFTRRPTVVFTTPDGTVVRTEPAAYRRRFQGEEGGTVGVRYRQDEPGKIVVEGFDSWVGALAPAFGIAVFVVTLWLSVWH